MIDKIQEKTEERWIRVTCCRTCPYLIYSLAALSPYCIKSHAANIVDYDTIHQLCPLRRENEAVWGK